MAADLGETSLNSLHHEGLDELLHDLANVYPASAHHQGSFGVPILDALMEVFISRTVGPAPEIHHEYLQNRTPSPQELEAEPQPEPESEPEPEPQPESESVEPDQLDDDEEMIFDYEVDYDNDAGLSEEDAAYYNLVFSGSAYRSKRPVPVLEISSSLSGAGKSQMVYYLTALAVLPRNSGDLHIGGQDAAVVFIDADDRFDIQRLRKIALNIIQQAQKTRQQTMEDQTEMVELSGDDIEAMIIESFKHIHLFRPQSSSALLATLTGLDKYLYDVSCHFSSSRPLHMLFIDSMTAFLWQDKLRDALARTEDLERSNEENDKLREQKQSFYFVDLYAELATELKRLQTRFGCTVVYTTTVSGFRPNKTPAQDGPIGPYDAPPSHTPALRPALPAPWGTFTILRLVVQRDTIRAFLPTMSINDAKRDASMRQSVVFKGKFSAYVNSWGREEWPTRVIDGLKDYGDGGFVFYVRDDGVSIPLPES